MSEYLLDRLGRLCAGMTYDALPPTYVHQVKRVILDSIGCALGGWRVKANRDLVLFLRDLDGAPEATIWGDGSKVPAPYAALAIGTIASHLESSLYSDITSAAFATGEMRHSDGRALIVAVAAALDVRAAIKQLLASGIEAHGLHWPAQASVYAATAAACTLLNATARQTTDALSFAGCLTPVAPFEAFTKGASVKDFYGGWCGMLGVMAARWGKVGFGGPPNLFEGKRGLGRTWRHAVPSTSELASAFAVAESHAAEAATFKAFAACTCAHPALSAIGILRARHPELAIEDIAHIEVETYGYAAELSGASSAETSISARVNIPYLCAAMLLDGTVGAEQTEEPRLSDPRLRELASRISVSVMPGTDQDLRARTRPASVRITTKDGQRLEASVSEPKWSGEDSPSDDDLERKFHQLVGELMAAERREALVRTLWQLESVSDVGDIVADLC